MTTATPTSTYSVPQEARKILLEGLLSNPLLPTLPPEIHDAAAQIQFTGTDEPQIPINWRFAESAASLKALEASLLNVLRKRKYGASMSRVEIDTNHASLFVMSAFMPPYLSKLLDGQFEPEDLDPAYLAKGFPSTDLDGAFASLRRRLVTNIYRTRDGRFYHTHGSLDPRPSLTALGMALDGREGEAYEEIVREYGEAVGKFGSAELDELMNGQYKQAGTICLSVDEYRDSEQGTANAHVGLYELEKAEGCAQPAAWWPENVSMPSSARRPLAGLKVVDLSRVIAAPAITRSLAEFGASVMRVTSPNVADLSMVHQDLNWGKWNCHLDLKRNPEDRKKLAALIREADVVVDGYRPGAMARNGFGREDIFELVKDRDRGIVVVRENCYGWHGHWRERSGWQQISDACCGVSLSYGRAMGHDEAVTPIFPNSDFCTGIAGSIAVLAALIRRAEEGGSYCINVALNYYSQWLVTSVGTYPEEVWNKLWERHGKPVYHHDHSMAHLLPSMFTLLREHDAETLFDSAFFEKRTSKAVGHDIVQIKPIARFADDVQLGFHVGSRSNGVDRAVWPDDLRTEIVT